MCSLCVKAWKKENPCFLACCRRSYSSFVAITCFGVWQVCTQRLWKWPYGVGLLVCGLDESGARWNYNCPSGNYFEYQAHWVSFTSCKDIFETHVWELCRLFAGRFDQGCSYCKRFKTRCCGFCCNSFIHVLSCTKLFWPSNIKCDC